MVGGQWVGQAPPRPTPVHLLTARANDRKKWRSRQRSTTRGPTGADEAYLPERIGVTHGPAGSCAISITAIVVVASKMKVTRQSTRTLTVSSEKPRRPRGGNGASAPQTVRSFPSDNETRQGQSTDESHGTYRNR